MGYCCIDDNDRLLQIFLTGEHNAKMKQVITTLLNKNLMNSARLSSAEPISFNTCLSLSKNIQSHTLCFQHTNTSLAIESPPRIKAVGTNDITAVKAFLKEQVGMDDTFGYTENLVARNEIYQVTESGKIVATSECRMSDSQPGIADLGIIVARDFQGNGLATQIMKSQINRVLQAGGKPICSTTSDNIASRKVIEKSGFYCSNIIFDMTFSDQ